MNEDPPLSELTALVREFVQERDWEQFHSPRNLAMALSVEAGELLELFLWSRDDGPQPAHAERQPKVADEAADVLMCLLNLCDRAEIDLAAALRSKLERARLKYPAERVRGQSRKYHEYKEWEASREDDGFDP